MITKIGFSQNGIQNRKNTQHSPSFKGVFYNAGKEFAEALMKKLPDALGDKFEVITLKNAVEQSLDPSELRTFLGIENIDFTNFLNKIFPAQDVSKVKLADVLYIEHEGTRAITPRDFLSGKIKTREDGANRMDQMAIGLKKEFAILEALEKAKSEEPEASVISWTWTNRAERAVKAVKEALDLSNIKSPIFSDKTTEKAKSLAETINSIIFC